MMQDLRKPDSRFPSIPILFHRQCQRTTTKVVCNLCRPAVYGSQADPVYHDSSLVFEISRIGPLIWDAMASILMVNLRRETVRVTEVQL